MGPTQIKTQKVNELLSKHHNFHQKFENQQLSATTQNRPFGVSNGDVWFDKVLDATPGRFQRTTKSLLDHIKGSNKMGWDQSGRLVIDGAVVEGTNVLDLVHSVTRPRKVAAPSGAVIFLKTLAEINTPT